MESPAAIRRFKEINTAFADREGQPAQTIDQFFSSHVVVVLGEPGLGKTTSFLQATELESNAEFVRIGEFLSLPNLHHLQGRTLYLDGLDEHRSRADGVDVIDMINAKLKLLGCPKVRISCRTAEWHGGKDLSALAVVSPDRSVVLLEMQPLTREDIRTILPDADDFFNGAEKHGFQEILRNPQDSILLYKYYCKQNKWPDNRSELMEGACNALLTEENDAHIDGMDEWVNDRDLRRASDYLQAILMLSNVVGIAGNRTSSRKGFPCIHQFDGNLYFLKAAMRRHVFKPIEGNRIEPKHRKIAEYMAARYLAARVREGLSIGRVMALMTGFDGGTPPDLRGVYAWLITLLSGRAEHILLHDPYGAIIYGDPHSWTLGTKKYALVALKKLSQKDPWFRGHDWSRSALGGLSEAALVADFVKIIEEDENDSHLVGAVFDIIAGGSELHGIGDSLMAYIRNTKHKDHLKDDAIDAFATACPDRLAELKDLLDDVNNEVVSDKNQYLRGALLRALYPSEILPSDIGKYLAPPSGGIIGRYHMFVRLHIFQLTKPSGLRDIADQVVNGMVRLDVFDDFDAANFRHRLVRNLIESLGSEATIEELSTWLSIGTGKNLYTGMRGEDARAVHDFFARNPNVYIDLFLVHFEASWSPEASWREIWWQFNALVVQATPPPMFCHAVLKRAEKESDESKANTLFALACNRAMHDEPGSYTTTIDDLIMASRQHPEFVEILNESSFCDVEDWRQESAEYKKRQIDERAGRQARNIDNLAPHREAIESGKALGYLDHYARVWFALFTDVDQEVGPKERLRQELGEDLAESILKGFLAFLRQPQINTVEEIAESDVEGKAFYRGYLVLAAMDLLSSNDKVSLLALPENTLRSAIAYHMVNVVDREVEWPKWIAKSKPDLYSSILDQFWRAKINKDPERVSDFYVFDEKDPRLIALRKVLPSILEDYPKAPAQLLQSMLINALRVCEPDTILSAVRGALKKRFKPGTGQRSMWLATGFRLASKEYRRALVNRLKTHRQERWGAREILSYEILQIGPDEKPQTSVEYRKSVVRILGAVFEQVHHETARVAQWVGDRNEASAADDIRRIIHAFAQDPDEEAAHALAELHEDDLLTQWRMDILFAIAGQIRTAREAQFTYPNVTQVVSTLADAEPANVTDLKALVRDALADIAKEIRHGNTDGYKNFWNIAKYGKPTDTHVDENTSRNRLLDRLRSKLGHLDIVAEPEVRYADEKRADIAIYSRGMKLPIEIKHDHHKDIWSAAIGQLSQQYARDPAAEGNGIYLVFWLGGMKMKAPPKPIKKPTDAQQLKAALELSIPEPSTPLIEVVVVDVSVPESKKAP